ncbi:hypothetical protein [Moorena sp. SIO4G3]|uniref:hypothetical protein n=1 Tax=Moorena sp. SIO4G3 TaxID=2607821 RepID=UPI00142B9300|nr:hypothetical protein [Moorena sp. SIO4G3]NEO78350.1 hypothetical protein [Moorena sp. SIO4G3]
MFEAASLKTLLPLASCLLPIASCLPLLGGVRGGFLLPLASCLHRKIAIHPNQLSTTPASVSTS